MSRLGVRNGPKRALELGTMAQLILKRASSSRSSGEWSDDDYYVLENRVVVGRIFKEPAAPEGRPWM